jgi:hypothetical protein
VLHAAQRALKRAAANSATAKQAAARATRR